MNLLDLNLYLRNSFILPFSLVYTPKEAMFFKRNDIKFLYGVDVACSSNGGKQQWRIFKVYDGDFKIKPIISWLV